MPFLASSLILKEIKGGVRYHVAGCLCIRQCLSIRLCIPSNFWGLWDHLTVCISPLIFIRRLMILFCCLYIPPNFWGLWDHLAACISPLILVRRLMRLPCCCLCIFPIFTFSMRSQLYQGGLWDHLTVCMSIFPNFFVLFAVPVVSRRLMRLPCYLSVSPPLHFLCCPYQNISTHRIYTTHRNKILDACSFLQCVDTWQFVAMVTWNCVMTMINLTLTKPSCTLYVEG
jgi:hypothetical protein